MKQFLKALIVRKLMQPSTHAGIGLMLMTVAPVLTPYAANVTAIIGAVFGGLAIYLNEGA